MKNILIVFGLMFTLMSFIFFGKGYDIPRDEQIVNTLMGQSAEMLSRKYKMKPVGVTVGMPGGIVKSLGLEFHISGPLAKTDIRKILIHASNDFFDAINNDTNIRPYLECYPFTKDKVEVTLYIYDKSHVRVDHPHIGIAYIRKNELHYNKLITTDIPNLKEKEKETTEEALKALKEDL